MSIRNILSLGLLILALVLCFLPWHPRQTASENPPSQEVSSPSPSSPLQEQPPKEHSPDTKETSEWYSYLLTHPKMLGFLIVCLLCVVGIFSAKRFFDQI